MSNNLKYFLFEIESNMSFKSNPPPQNQHNQHDNSIYFIPFQNRIFTQAHKYNILQVQS